MQRFYIKVRATDAHKQDDGSYVLEIPAREISKEEEATLKKLFPDFEPAIGYLLQKQALLSSIVQPSWSIRR